jgi:hypothetical protein
LLGVRRVLVKLAAKLPKIKMNEATMVIIHPELHIGTEINKIEAHLISCENDRDEQTYTSLIRSSGFFSRLHEAESTGKDGSFNPGIGNIMLDHLSDIPPLGLFFEAKTEDQVRHWVSGKKRFLDIYSSLKSYFGGSEPFQIAYDDPKEQEITELMRDDYIALYSVIHQGWSIISPGLKKINYPLNSPGEVLIEIITLECICYMSMAFPRLAPGNKVDSQFSPQSLYRIRNEYQKLEKNQRLPDKRFLEKFKRHFGYQVQWGFFLRDLCIHLIEMKAKQKKSTLHRKLVEYRRIDSLLWESVFSKWHPRKNLSGSRWIDGRIFP